jgi:hypothetical protein
MSEAKMKDRIQKLEVALQAIIRERGDTYGDVDMQSLWDAIEGAKPLFNRVGQYGNINDRGFQHMQVGGPGFNTSVKIIAENDTKFKVQWFVNANQPLYSLVPKEWVDF